MKRYTPHDVLVDTIRYGDRFKMGGFTYEVRYIIVHDDYVEITSHLCAMPSRIVSIRIDARQVFLVHRPKKDKS